MKITNQRHLFDLPDEVVYFNCASQSPQLKEITRIGQIGVGRKARPWLLSTEERLEVVETARGLFGQLVGAKAEEIAIIPSVSYGIAIAASNLQIGPDQQILMVEEEFPSDVYPWRELAKLKGASIVTVKRPADFDWTGAILAQIGQNTAVVTVPNCHWTDGSLIDLKRVGQRAREVGAAFVIDATQSAGAYPLDIKEIQPDFLVAAAYKWLLGPYSLAFLYVSPTRWQGLPIEHGWFNRAGSEDYSQVANYRDDYRDGARRFDVGERSDYLLLPMANVALRQILDWGVENIAARLGELTGIIENGLADSGFSAVPAARRVPHIIGLRSKNIAVGELVAKLAAQKIFVSLRGQVLRISPHLYNTEKELEQFLAVLAEGH